MSSEKDQGSAETHSFPRETKPSQCDERQPTCSNCERSRRYICDGYQNLRSLADDPEPQNGPKLAGLDTARTSTNETAIAWLLRDFDVELTPPLGVSDAGQSIVDQHPGWSAGLTEHTTSEDVGLNLLRGDILPPMSGLAHFEHESNFIEAVLPWSQQQSPSRVLSCFDMDHNSSEPPRVQIPRSLGTASPANLCTDSFEISENTSRLLDHYRTHVSQLMMPTSAPSHNPWLRLYLPISLQEPQTLAKRCLLFGLLAVAAFNKANLPIDDSESYRQQANEFKEKAASTLKRIFESSSKTEGFLHEATEKHALLAAALTMTTVEVFSGADEGKGYESLLLAKRIIRITGGLEWWLSDASGMTLLQIFRCLQIVAYTSGWVFPSDAQAEEDDRRTEEIPTGNADIGVDPFSITHGLPGRPGQYTLDVSFGVSMKTLRCLNTIIELSNIKRRDGGAQNWPLAHRAEIQRLETELFDPMTQPDTLGSQHTGAAGIHEGMSSYVSEEIMENHIWAFHYSTAIFYRRAICNGAKSVDAPGMPKYGSEHSTGRPSGQDLVSKALEHLENVDALSSDIAIANTLWPGFIAAVEAVDMELRHRALIWFARAKRHGIGNISKAKALVLEVWRRVDRQTWIRPDRKNMQGDLSHVDWREVMREKGWFIMLT